MAAFEEMDGARGNRTSLRPVSTMLDVDHHKSTDHKNLALVDQNTENSEPDLIDVTMMSPQKPKAE